MIADAETFISKPTDRLRGIQAIFQSSGVNTDKRGSVPGERY